MDWGGDYCLVGLRAPVSGEFLLGDLSDDGELDLNVAPETLDEHFDAESSARRAVEALNIETRLLTRMVCAPSGELPTGPIARLHVGEDYLGRPGAGGAVIDELRFHAPRTPGELLPDTGRYVLAEELPFEEDEVLRLRVNALDMPHGRVEDTVLGADALEILSELPQAGGLLLLGEEVIGYAGLDPVDTGHVFMTARGLYGTRRAYHAEGTPVLPLLAWPVAPLASRLSETGARIVLADGAGFPASGGLVLVDEELLEYTGRDGATLEMPTRPGSNRFDPAGLLRGRFGTVAGEHAPGAMVRWQPARYRDRALLGSDVPESSSWPVGVRAPGAFFTDLVVTAFLPDPTVALEVRAVFDGLASPHDDPLVSPALLSFGGDVVGPALEARLGGPLARQADRLELSFFARWGAGAFDALDHRSNGWKLVPEVGSVVVGHVQPTLVFEHEEWR
jgi:hypothetical protein